MLNLLVFLLFVRAFCEPFGNPHPQVTLPNDDVIHGKMELFVETFKGIPYAEPPVGELRFRPPVTYGRSLNGFNATNFGNSCIPMNATAGLDLSDIPTDAQGELSSVLASFNAKPTSNSSEDCLNLNVFRPWGNMIHNKLPVMVWIYGGGFEIGSADDYPFNRHIIQSMMMNQSIIVVSFNYRLGAYGFLGGRQILEEGSSNAGLLDQRMALQWVADNIESFGGDPDNVTLFGQSSGSMSVVYQMTLYDGNNTYKGKPLFHGGILQSGVTFPSHDIDSHYPQQNFDQLVTAAGCEGQDSLKCLRSRPSGNITSSENTLPGVISYRNMKVSFMPRPDGKVISDDVVNLIDQGKFARVPFIAGNQEDEATLTGLLTLNITNIEGWNSYLNLLFDREPNFFDQATEYSDSCLPDSCLALGLGSIISKLSHLYQQPDLGCPYRTGDENQITPQYKQIASFIGDYGFHASRRRFLRKASELGIPTWSYQASTNYNSSRLGTVHGSDISWAFKGPYNSNPTLSYLKYFISFANSKDPNNDLPNWPKYSTSTMLNISSQENSLLNDTFRQEPIEFLINNLSKLLI